MPGRSDPYPGRGGDRDGDGDGVRDRDQGMVTVELAIGIPLLLITVLGLVWLVNVVRVEALAQDAARSAVRVLIRGEGRASAAATARRILPGARVEVTIAGGRAVARVRTRLSGPGPVLGNWSRSVSARSVGLVEAAAGSDGTR